MKRLYSVSSKFALCACLLVSTVLPCMVQAQSLSFTQIPYTDPDLNRPGAGAEQWNDQNMTNIPVEGTNTRRLDKYFRFSWSMFESGQGVYTWSKFDQEINDAISKGQKFSFGIMTHYPDAVSPHRVNYDGGYSVYPQYLHNLMQAETVKDWRASNGSWVPNWNSEAYLSRLLALNQAINNHINTTSYNGVAYKDVINYIDIRGYGAFGEWHSYTIVDVMSQYPAGTRATTASLNRIIDAHVDAFPNFPLVIMVSAFDGNRLGNTMNPPEVAYHALTRRNNYGPVGWRRDNWGATDTYLRWYTDQNTLTVSGMRLDTAIMNRWKYAPVVGEPCCNADYADLENQVKRYHAVSFGNGNFSPNGTINPNMRAASKAAGYRIILEGGSVAASVSTGTAFPVTLQWKNVGLTQSYEDWDVLYELKNSAGTAVWSSVSAFQIKMFLPETTARAHTDNLTLPGNVTAGTYTLTVKVRDADGFRTPMPLAITGRNSDGSYTLRTLTVSTGSAVPNQPPVANAGSNQIITLPTSTATLTGNASSDPDGTIASYLWQQVSGPSTSALSSTSTANITVSNLVQGTYTYRLTVTDNASATSSATVTVTVNAATNQAPVANAGSNATITLPVNSASLNGSASTDPDGTIAGYLWQQVSGPSTSTLSSTSTASISVSNLIQGTYTYRLTVTDNAGATASATVTVTVNAAANQAPVANAGTNVTITLPANSAGLNGSASTDPDGTIASYLWQQVNGPSASTLSSTSTANITVSNLVQGTYTYRLTVTDNAGATASATVTVTVNAAPNQVPVANAGADQSITLPVSTANLNGSASTDPDGTIASYLWQQVSGPSTSVLSSTTTANITVSNLVQGVYTYRLTVRDNNNATSTDLVRVTVNSPTNQTPVADAGTNQAIRLPVNTASLNGSASSDPDGSIASYQWTQLSGPAASVFSSATAANTTVSSLQQGVYTYQLTVTDNAGATATDIVTVTVNAANVVPVADAGNNITITLPVSTAVLDGTGSNDADGSITAYTWQQVSGPSTSTLSSATTARITVSNLIQGVYTYRLTVRDNDGATNTATVTVTVNAAPNVNPVANAGTDRAITLPTNSVQLNGSASSDPDGVISTYLWQQVSGPSTATLSATNTSIITASNLVQGVYVFRLTVRDNRNATASDQVTITVNSAPNVAPVANAGNNRSITLPVNSTVLSGAGSRDSDGTIAGYTWQQVSGPSTANMSAPNAVSNTVTNLVQGVYVFRLTVRDNANATASTTVTVTVLPQPNELPVAIAGDDISVTTISNTATLDGSKSYDPDGTALTYQWRQLTGPSNAAFSATNQAIVTVSDLVAGEYEYILTVRDSRNATANDTVKVIVVDNFQGRGQTLVLFPNPADGASTNLRVLSEKPGYLSVNIYDMTGRRIQSPVVVDKPQGAYTVTLDVSKLRPGNYVVEAVFDGQNKKVTTKLIKR
ncbi:MAG: PKD domain-containing protein [Chitinophagaceae bacterium]